MESEASFSEMAVVSSLERNRSYKTICIANLMYSDRCRTS